MVLWKKYTLVNSVWYIIIFLPEIFVKYEKLSAVDIFSKIEPVAQTSNILSTQNVDLMGRPPYNHDLTPND